jgi:alpha-ketoglutarate-dependent taurine dioxygenase
VNPRPQESRNEHCERCDVLIEELDFGDLRGGVPMVCPGPCDAAEWAAANAGRIEDVLNTRGGLLVRGIAIAGSKALGQVLESAFGAALVDYDYRSTPRTRLRGNVYTSTEYHPAESIPQHNEQAYANHWPLRIGFYSDIVAPEGGMTPIADSRRVYRMLRPALVEDFERRGLLYVRHYTDIDLPWTEVFQTDRRDEVEDYCAENGLAVEWTADGLTTRQVAAATATHPVSGETLWFNQAHLFHLSAHSPVTQDDLLRVFGEDRLPRNVYHADGSAIDPVTLHEIRAVYEACKISFAWRQGDLLLLDNMLFSHGREPYAGDRRVLVGMARPCHSAIPRRDARRGSQESNR